MKKYRIYIDEVGDSDLKSSRDSEHRYLCLAGVIMDTEYVRETFHPWLEHLKKRYFDHHPDEPLVFHRKELLKAKPPFSRLQYPEIRVQFNEELKQLIREADYQIISVFINKLEHDDVYLSWKYDPYHYCQEVILERFRLFLNLHNAKGDVMIESRGGKEDRRLKDSFENLMENGTHFLKPDELREVITSKQLKIKPKTANIAGLQLADLVAHPVRRWFLQNVLEDHDGQATFADEIISAFEPKIFQYKGEVLGYGMKKLP